MNACPDDEELSAYVEQTSANPDAIEAHVDACDACRVVVAHLAAVGALVGDASGKGRGDAHQTVPMQDVDTVAEERAPTFYGSPLLRGARVDRYVVDGELGRGGMGVVLAAHDPQLARTVALKLVRAGIGDESARARLLREARAMARLSHPNVVAIHDVGELDDGRVFLAMEHVRGTTLRRVLAEGRRPLARTLDLFLQAGHGLAAAHAAGLIHRDFKPENVLVGEDGRVRVTDFGLARGTGRAGMPPPSARGGGAAEPPPSGLSGAGAIMGTPAYMAPEQYLGLPATPATDQFAFCVTLFEALTGVRPFPGRTLDELAKAKLGDERRAWPGEPAVPPAIKAMVDRGLSPAMEDRHPSMDALLAGLERARGAIAFRRLRRSLVAIPLAALGIGLAALGIVAARRSPTAAALPSPALCADGGQAMRGIWNDAKKAELRAALARNAVAPLAVDEALAALDGQTHAWTAMHDASCEATRAGAQTEGVHRLRAACLRRRWNELVETIDVLAREPIDPDDAFLGDPLGSIRACADLRTLAAVDPLPEDPGERARVEDLYARIARVRAASRGQWTSVDAFAQGAAAVRFKPVLAELALLGAELSAGTTMDEALHAAESSRDDELLARARRAAARKADVSGHGAFAELSTALAAATRLERPDLRADVLEQRAVAEAEFGSFRAAAASAKEALALRESGAETPRRPRALWSVELALLRAQAALELEDLATAKDALAALDPVHDDAVRAERLVLGARLAIGEGHPELALPLLADARKLSTAVLSRAGGAAATRDRRAKRRAHHALYGAMGATAAAEVALGRAADAERDFSEALARLTHDGYGLEPFVQVRGVVALNRLQRGRVPAALALARAKGAFKVVEGFDSSPIVAEALVGLGQALVESGDAAGALAQLTRAEVLARDAPARLWVECASALLTAARAHGADPSARPRAALVARRALAESSADTPGRGALAALVAGEP